VLSQSGVTDDDRKTLDAMTTELAQLRELMRDPQLAERLSLGAIAKLASKATARDRMMASNVAHVLLELGEPLRAGSIYQSLMELDPDEPYYRLGRAQAHLRSDEPRAALLRFDEALALAPSLGEAYMGRAEARMKLDDTRGAFEDFEKVVELEPDSTFAQLARVMLMGGSRGLPS
jgi:tetratricopeptide (TPR) repeat protein